MDMNKYEIIKLFTANVKAERTGKNYSQKFLAKEAKITVEY